MAYEGGGFDEWDWVISISEIESRSSEEISHAGFILYLYARSSDNVKCINICHQRKVGSRLLKVEIAKIAVLCDANPCISDWPKIHRA